MRVRTQISTFRWMVLLSLVTAVLHSAPILASVTVTSFTAVVSGDDILLEWQTESELDHLGFNLLRTEVDSADIETLKQNGQTSLVNPQLIAGAGGVGSASYNLIDDDVEAGVTYYYWLESIDLNGMAEYSGPRAAIISSGVGLGGSATATPTATATATATPDATPTDEPTATPEATPTPTPTEATSNGEADPTESPTSTVPPTATNTPSPTATTAIVSSDTATETPLSSPTSQIVNATATLPPTVQPTATFAPIGSVGNTNEETNQDTNEPAPVVQQPAVGQPVTAVEPEAVAEGSADQDDTIIVEEVSELPEGQRVGTEELDQIAGDQINAVAPDASTVPEDTLTVGTDPNAPPASVIGADVPLADGAVSESAENQSSSRAGVLGIMAGLVAVTLLAVAGIGAFLIRKRQSNQA